MNGARWTLLDARALLPAIWRPLAGDAPLWCFNPGLLRQPKGWLLAYRVVLADQQRRIAACRLDENLAVIEGSPVPLSDHIRFAPGPAYFARATGWFADPRLYAAEGRVFLYFNSGWHEPRNHQFVVEVDPATLLPAGSALELDLVVPRQALEKNWVFLPGGLDTLVYAPAPHRLARCVAQVDGRLLYELDAPAAPGAADSPPGRTDGPTPVTALDRLGPGLLRGGAPPVLHQGRFYSFCHFIPSKPEAIDYRLAVYRFEALPPYAPEAEGAVCLDLPLPEAGRRRWPALNPAVREVLYPGGAVLQGQDWHLACGINDEHCALLRLPAAQVDACLATDPAQSPQQRASSSR